MLFLCLNKYKKKESIQIMYDVFKEMVSQLFNNPDLYQYVWIEGRKYKCICSSLAGGVMFTEAGMVDQANFTLDLELATLDRIPHQNDKLVFRDKQYKVSHIETDSANTSIKVYMISMSKGG